MLVSHEELRTRGALKIFDSFEEYKEFAQRMTRAVTAARRSMARPRHGGASQRNSAAAIRRTRAKFRRNSSRHVLRRAHATCSDLNAFDNNERRPARRKFKSNTQIGHLDAAQGLQEVLLPRRGAGGGCEARPRHQAAAHHPAALGETHAERVTVLRAVHDGLNRSGTPIQNAQNQPRPHSGQNSQLDLSVAPKAICNDAGNVSAWRVAMEFPFTPDGPQCGRDMAMVTAHIHRSKTLRSHGDDQRQPIVCCMKCFKSHGFRRPIPSW